MTEFILYFVSVLAIILALILAFTQSRTGRPEGPAPENAVTERQPLGEKAGATLLAVFQDFYRQEVAAEEDVHRSLPFFATALGLTIAAVNYVAAQLPDWGTVLDACSKDHKTFGRIAATCAWPAWLPAVCLCGAALAIGRVLWLLSVATAPRSYERVGPEKAYIDRANQLRDYYTALGLTDDALDVAVNLDLREQLLDDFARILPHNRVISIRRYNSRARAFRALLWSLFLALLATIIILMTAKAGLLPTKGIHDHT
jgi:hypothetical protein